MEKSLKKQKNIISLIHKAKYASYLFSMNFRKQVELKLHTFGAFIKTLKCYTYIAKIGQRKTEYGRIEKFSLIANKNIFLICITSRST